MQNSETPITLPQTPPAQTETQIQTAESEGVKAGNEASQASFSGETNTNSDNQSSILHPKFKSIEEQAQAYLEAEKALTRKSQELSDTKKELETFRNPSSKKDQQQDFEQQEDSKGQFSKGILDIERLENIAKSDYKTINSLCNSGIINQARASYMRKHVAANLNQEKQKIFSKFRNVLNPVKSDGATAAVSEFCTQNPGFFDNEERGKVLNYLKQTTDSICKNDLEAIADLIQSVEKSAVEHYQKALDKQSSLQNQNEKAKSKLTSVSQVDTKGNIEGQKTFTRDEIRRMTKKEFEKNETKIMEQMTKGLIK